MANSNKKAFVVYNDWQRLFEALESDAERGRLIMALFSYAHDGGRLPEEGLSGAGKMALLFMSAQLDRDYEKWENVCKRNAANGKKGGAPKGNKNACKVKPSDQNDPKRPKRPDTDNNTEKRKEK